MEVVMVLNGVELVADVDESEAVVLMIATRVLDREGLARWLAEHQVLQLLGAWLHHPSSVGRSFTFPEALPAQRSAGDS
ncbi:hypothetical protein MNNICLKF_01475 [Synechococcus sp. CBW1107]|nr:hypothetical protein MNNICLKF_01475 [Synechococcus sp. CBW1107]